MYYLLLAAILAGTLVVAAPVLLIALLVLAWACFLSWLSVELFRPSDD